MTPNLHRRARTGMLAATLAPALALGAARAQAAEPAKASEPTRGEPAKASAHPEDLVRLMSYLDVIPTVEQLRAVGAGDGAALARIAADRSLHRYVRMRAASSLGAFDSPATRTALAARVDADDDDREVRLQALAALTFLEKARGVPRLERLLGHGDPELRAGALRNLARLGEPAARATLEAFVARGTEPTPWVKALAEESLRALARPR